MQQKVAPNNAVRVCVYGLTGVVPEGTAPGWHFATADLNITAFFDEADVIVLPWSHNVGEQRNCEQLQSRLVKAWEDGRVLCFLVNQPTDEPRFCLARALLREAQVKNDGWAAGNDFGMCDADFRDVIRGWGSISQGFLDQNEDRDDVYTFCRASTRLSSRAVGIVVKRGPGLAYFVPAWPAGEPLDRFLQALVRALYKNVPKHRHPQSHPIVEDFLFAKEVERRQNRANLVKRVEALDKEIGEFREAKEILYLADNALKDRMGPWLRTYLDINYRLPGGPLGDEFKEDLWLVDADGEDAAICEVTARGGRTSPRDVAQLVDARTRRELTVDFHGVLFINSHRDARTMAEKTGEEPDHEAIRLATINNIGIVTTADLVKMLDLVQQAKLDKEDAGRVTATEAGWLRVVDERLEVKRIEK
jgi:hypothetical protein